MNTGIIILAAGSSSRLGKPKQLLPFRGKSLLDIVTEAALQAGLKPILVILGAHANEIPKVTGNDIVRYLVNDNWTEGMSSSIAFGTDKLRTQFPEVENVIISVSDQAFIGAEVFNGLVKKQQATGKNIIASQYGQTIGTPVMFNKKYFDQLTALKGDNGAKQILNLHSEDTDIIPFALGRVDIDTETDYHNLINYK